MSAASMDPEQFMQQFMNKMQTQKSELTQLRERVATLEQQIAQATHHTPTCTCHCPGPRGQLVTKATSAAAADTHMTDDATVAAAPHPHIADDTHMVDSSSLPLSSEGSSSILNIIFGEHESANKRPIKTSTTSSTTTATTAILNKSPPRTRALATTAASHLSPPRVRGSRSPQQSGSGSHTSISDAEKVLQQLGGEDDLATVATANTSASKTSGKKRKSGERDGETTANTGENEDMDATDTQVREKTNKFIKITSPSNEIARVSTVGVDKPELDQNRLIADFVQPSQDAYDQEEESGADLFHDSPEFDYGEKLGAHTTSPSPTSAYQIKFAEWSSLITPLSPPVLQKASNESNLVKEKGNNEFKAGQYLQALDSYSQAIRILEAPLKGTDSLQKWIQLSSDEATKGEAAIESDLKMIREIFTATHTGNTISKTDIYVLMKNILHQLSSIYANRATCYAKIKPPSYFAALADVHHVLALQPTWFKGYSIKASILAQQKQVVEACKEFQNALASPGISPAERTKILERLNQLQSKLTTGAAAGAKRSEDRSSDSDAHSSQSVASLSSTRHAPAIKGSPIRRSHSDAAITTTSVGSSSSTRFGALAGTTAAQPIQVQSSSSASPPLHSGAGSPAGGMIFEPIPVHPPSIHTPITPPGSEQQQFQKQGSTEKLFNERQDSMDLLLRAETPPTTTAPAQTARVKEEELKAALAKPTIKAEPPIRPRSPLPLTEAHTNRLNSPAPVTSARVPHSPTHGPQRVPIHDLTVSPTKKPRASAAASTATTTGPQSGSSARSSTRHHHPSPSKSKSPQRSPARSPARSPLPPENWFVFPLVTAEGIRDLVGDETFAESLNLYVNRRIEAIKVSPVLEGGPPRLVGLALKKDAPRSRSRHQPILPSNLESKENYTHTVSLRFDDGTENRVKEFHCDCRDESHPPPVDSTTGAAAAATTTHHGPFSPPPTIHKVWTPCVHVGAILLVLKKKQEDVEKLKPLTWSTAERAQRSMFITPSRRRSAPEMQKEAAMRAELEEKSNSYLSDLLARNNQSKSGSKPVLIARIIENSQRGNLPRCKKCKGSLFYASGGYHCHGGYDPVSKRVLQCDFYTDRAERIAWQQ